MGVERVTNAELTPSVAAAFDAVAWEIELAGARCIQLDAIVGELTRTVPAAQRDRLTEGLHTVDLLAQHLTGLSAFVRRLGEDAPAEAAIRISGALADITLGALADRLFSALGGEESAGVELCEAGAVDLF